LEEWSVTLRRLLAETADLVKRGLFGVAGRSSVIGHHNEIGFVLFFTCIGDA
jgi:hypothetical protein